MPIIRITILTILFTILMAPLGSEWVLRAINIEQPFGNQLRNIDADIVTNSLPISAEFAMVLKERTDLEEYQLYLPVIQR